MRQLKHDFFIDSLHIFTLCGFAIAQPLFDLLSRNATFFIARHSEPIDIVCLTLILVVPIPATVVLIEAMAEKISRTAQKTPHGVIVVCLTALIILPVF